MVQKKNSGYFALVTKITTSLLITITIFITILIFILHTSYGLPFLQKSIEKLTDAKIHTTDFKYDFLDPFTFYFENLSIETSTQKISHFDELNLKIAPIDSILKARLVLKEAWLKGTTFTNDKPPFLPKSLMVKQLSLEKINVVTEKFTLENADIQLSNWQNLDGWGKSEGNFMFSAQRVQFAKENFDEVLIDGTQQDNDWEFWRASLSSNFGELNFSASFNNNKLTFEQLKLTDAKIQPAQSEQSKALYAKLQAWLAQHRVAIERLDLLNINAAIEKANIERLNLTAHNIELNQGKFEWQEEKATKFSFSAESFNIRQWVSSDLLGEISISKQSVDIASLSSKLMNNGFMTVRGKLSRSAANFSDFTVNGIDLALNTDEIKFIEEYWNSLEKFSVENLAIKRANLTIAEPNYPVYVTDLNIRATKLFAQNEGTGQIWQGEANLNANAASINHIQLTNPIINAQMNQNRWQISSELPFAEGGLLKLSAHLNTKNSSHPWQVQGQGISVPSSIYQQWFNAKLPLQGEHDIEIDLYGLSITKEALRYSLSGSLNATLYNSKLEPTKDQPLAEELTKLLLPKSKQIDSPSELENSNTAVEDFTIARKKIDSVIALKTGKVDLKFDRGQITLNPMAISTEDNQIILQGRWDFVTRQGSFTSK